MPDNLGPPGGLDGEGRANPANVENVDTTPPITYSRQNSSPRRQCSPETPPWRRRRRASYRLEPLDYCGCRDPWPCRCSRPPLSQKFIDAGAQAARHVLATGQVPLLELEVLRALYRRGGDDRALAQELYDLVGGEIA